MSTTEYYLLSRAREILAEVQDVFASSQQEGSVMHQKAFRSALVNHLDAAERQQVPLKQLISFLKTLRGTEGVGDVLSEVTLGLISKSMEEGLRTTPVTTQVRYQYSSYSAFSPVHTYIHIIGFECETSGYNYLFGFYTLNAVNTYMHVPTALKHA